MQNEPNFENFRQAFSARVELADAVGGALKSTPSDIERLTEACSGFESSVAGLGKGQAEDQYRAFNLATSIFLALAQWKHAIRNAEPDAQRFLKSAKLKASEIDRSLSFTSDELLFAFLDLVAGLQCVDELDQIQEQLQRWTLPLLLFANLPTERVDELRIPVNNRSAKPEKLDTSVAFLRFEIDGEPATHWNYLRPGTAYDLTIEVRVSNWPIDANALLLTPVTVDIRERDWLPKFKFEQPDGDGPHVLAATGRAVLETAHSFGSRPYEFLYAAEFDDTSNCKEVSIVGHRRLIIEGSDVGSHPLTGFSNVDRHLLDVRNRLRSFPGLNPDDIANTMTVLGGLGNLAAQALKEGLFEAGTSENKFQKDTTTMLRSRTDIGEHLQGHLEAAGGITDLSFHNIPIELKVEHGKVLFPKDFERYFDQTAAYAIGLGKRIAVLSVLETSPKESPVGVIEDDIEVLVHPSGQSSIAIIVVVVRGGFPKPSSYSRKKTA